MGEVLAVSDAEQQRQLRRAVVASTIGTAIEWYDFFLYSVITGLVFPKLFFPDSEALTGTLQAFSVYAVGFIARPIGAAVFGHYGDRIGRKSTLVVTLIIMGLSTFAVGLVPTHESIGIWGAVILTVLRFIQGVGVGGEWGGAVLLTMEWTKTNKHRGFVTSWPQFGVPVGLFLANVVVYAFGRMSDADFLAYGWRLPFLFSIVMLAIGLYIRLGVMETPTFQRLVREKKIERQPMLEVLRKQPKEIIVSALARTGQQASFYIFTAFIFSYATAALHMPRDFVIKAVLTAAMMSFITVPFFGWLSDRWGRKRTYILGLAATGVYILIYYALLDTMAPTWIFVAIAFSLVAHDMAYGPQGALVAENFTGRLRYSGASMGYQLASIIAGGPAPLIATYLFATYHSGFAIAIYLLITLAISIVATLFIPDRTNRDISEEYDA